MFMENSNKYANDRRTKDYWKWVRYHKLASLRTKIGEILVKYSRPKHDFLEWFKYVLFLTPVKQKYMIWDIKKHLHEIILHMYRVYTLYMLHLLFN